MQNKVNCKVSEERESEESLALKLVCKESDFCFQSRLMITSESREET